MDEQPLTHAGFLAHLKEGRLMGSRCTGCGAVYLPPRGLCVRCYSSQLQWHPFSGQGTLTGFTFIHIALPEMAAEGYSRERPYCTGVVTLAEGPAVSGQIVGVDAARPETVHHGMPLRVVFPTGDGPTRLVFEPA